MLRNWIMRKLVTRQRRLFAFWDGRKIVRLDPMVIIRRLAENPDYDSDNDFKRLSSPKSSTRGEAIGGLAAVAREAFGLPLFDGKHGLTEMELLKLLNSFNGQMDALKKNMRLTPEFEPSTATSEMPSDSRAETNTSDMSGSGSMPQTA